MKTYTTTTTAPTFNEVSTIVRQYIAHKAQEMAATTMASVRKARTITSKVVRALWSRYDEQITAAVVITFALVVILIAADVQAACM